MKRQSIFLILLLLQILLRCIGCGSAEKSAEPESFAAAAKEAAAVTEEAALEEAAAPAEASFEAESAPMEDSIELEESALSEEMIVEDAVGIFEGLEDNHTAIFSFDGAEIAFFFEDPAVHDVLFEAVLGSAYTLSYEYSDSTGHVIYKISEH